MKAYLTVLLVILLGAIAYYGLDTSAPPNTLTVRDSGDPSAVASGSGPVVSGAKEAGAGAGQTPALDDDAAATLSFIRGYWSREGVVPRSSVLEYPPFTAPPRKEELEYYPCMDCHGDTEDRSLNNPKQRMLDDEHEAIVLTHGGERFWCHTCHNINDMNYLRSMKSENIDFNQSYLLCGQCHFHRQKDWFFGGHGKRISAWNGPKVIILCVECHNPHSPDIKPKKPDPPPKKHQGPSPLFLWSDQTAAIEREIPHEELRIWDVLQQQRTATEAKNVHRE